MNEHPFFFKLYKNLRLDFRILLGFFFKNFHHFDSQGYCRHLSPAQEVKARM
ncbi:hypothetical protein BVRB_8g188980 [Beta vulgaris subsp. vulgaris]|nr:hypothetical protein BVRB_8g188980 [Beta vulgaris subsp. vulgaris]